jgi:hypothetical protein
LLSTLLHITTQPTTHVCVQVTNRDLSVAVLRSFLPKLAEEASEGKLKKQRAKQKQGKAAAAGAEEATGQVSPVSETLSCSRYQLQGLTCLNIPSAQTNQSAALNPAET